MSIKVDNNIGAFVQHIQAETKRRAIVTLKRVGEEAVAEAVQSGNYTDHSGHLRSSIGYVIADNGDIVAEGGFYQIGIDDEGVQKGREKAAKVASEREGLVLVLVAGMQYASLVADRGFNVLDSAEILAQTLLKQLTK